MKIEYREEEGMMLPKLSTTETPQAEFGPFAAKRLRYLKEERPTLYTDLLVSGQLDLHLMEIERSACEMMEILVSRSAQAQGIDEAMKRNSPEQWVQAMGEIRTTANNTVMREVVLT